MTIAYIYHSMSAFGGIERVWADKMNYLAEHYPDFKIHFITCDQCGDKLSYPLSSKITHTDLQGLRYHDLYHYRYPMRFLYLWRFKRDFKKRLKSQLEKIRPDVIVCTTTFASDWIAQLHYPCKTVVEAHMAQQFCFKAGDVHKSNQSFLEYRLKTLYDKRFVRTIKKYDKMVVLTREDVKGWAPYRDAVCIPNPITYYPEESTDLPGSKLIVAVGRLEAQKGFDLLVKAWSKVAAKCPEWHVRVYGEGSKRAELERLIETENVSSSFHLMGADNSIYQRYAEAEFLVFSSRVEGFGLVLIENMSCGRACVSFDCPVGPADIITDGHDGLLVKNGDVDALASKLEWMIEHDSERSAMGRNARVSARRFMQDSIMPQWANLFNDLVNS